jgi:hypothetical protein
MLENVAKRAVPILEKVAEKVAKKALRVAITSAFPAAAFIPLPLA